jgi:hypothetical protein
MSSKLLVASEDAAETGVKSAPIPVESSPALPLPQYFKPLPAETS